MDPLPTYLRAFFGHWASLVSGTLVGGVLFIADANGKQVPQFWYQVTGMVAVFFAGYLTWRDQEQATSALQQEIDAKDSTPSKVETPAVSFGVRTSEGLVYVDVTNTSNVQADYRVEVVTDPPVGGHSRFEAAWVEGEQGPRLVPAGQTRAIRLAILYANSGFFQWALLTPRSHDKRPIFRVTELQTTPAHVRMGQSLAVQIEVVTTPQLEDGIASKRLIFEGAEVVDVADGHRLRPISEARQKVF